MAGRPQARRAWGTRLARGLAQRGRTALRASSTTSSVRGGVARYDRLSGEGYYRNAFDSRRYAGCSATRRLRRNGYGRCRVCSIDPLTQVDHAEHLARRCRRTVCCSSTGVRLPSRARPCWDLRIWVHIGPELSVRRGIAPKRDAGRRSRNAAEALHRDRYLAAEAHLYVRRGGPGGARRRRRRQHRHRSTATAPRLTIAKARTTAPVSRGRRASDRRDDLRR